MKFRIFQKRIIAPRPKVQRNRAKKEKEKEKEKHGKKKCPLSNQSS
jgi:hypothetical protein